ncbi:MAG: hypothetical protein ABI388_09700, partial [Bacteroidia bacterium]
MEFSAGNITKISEHVIEVFFTRDAEVDEKIAIEILTRIIELTEGGPHALLYDFNKRNVILSDITRKISGVRNYN